MSKHTPGPWTHVTGGISIKAPSNHLSFQLIATVCEGRKTTSEVDANARLIAAAPDLLEFAEEVRRTGDTRLASMAIAVIAKAIGEAK